MDKRIYGILADYEDQNDHDTLRRDPVFKLIADRLPDGPHLASQPTLSRFENAVSIPDLWRLRDVLVNLFIQSFDEPPRHLTLDIDAFDDPAPGQQQLTFFHGYYEQYQYLPIVFTCAENDMVPLVGLRHGTCDAFLGVNNNLRYLIGRLRAVWPDVHVHVRADSGLGVPLMYDVCRELRLSYTFGIGVNPRLQAMSDALMKRALEDYKGDESDPAIVHVTRLSGEELVGVAAGRHQGGSESRRDQSTGRGHEPTRLPGPPASDLRRVRDARREREPEQGTQGRIACRPPQRSSVHGELLPLYLHAASLNLLVRLRRGVVATAPTSAEVGEPAELPTEALDQPARRKFFNKRHHRDPLGEGSACTWRTRLIKVAAEVITRPLGVGS